LGLTVLSEVPFEVSCADIDRIVYIQDFGLLKADGEAVDIAAIRDSFHETFARVWDGEMEDDGFNSLVFQSGLSWREVVIVRAYCKFLRQARIPFSQDYMEETLASNGDLSRLIVALFHTRFNPDLNNSRERKEQSILGRLNTLLDDVANLDEDRILRHFVNMVQATLRTNYYQLDEVGGPKSYVSFKLDSKLIDELPQPRPLREIFVYSPRFEGVHLRFGLVARGGLRWSDRREDFRTEVLGLVKAQQVKNGVIVPVGSKGGFVLKKAPPPSDRDGFMAEGVACYKTFIGGLLDITDNLAGEKVLRPERVVRKDGDDPYLVVAADKGTATFSDYANGIARDYGFWLDDAFASGGSVGYDHKKMGITARGAWESVKRHFREMGHNTQTQDFTVVGVGDMSGDVFGNGMLLSRHIKLLGGFNHLHIFVDPDPNPAASYAERKRLFELARSSWIDYDAKLISKGGGVFDRSAKSIDLTPEIKQLFGIAEDRVTPNALLKAMLLAEADLLWFGGIGTYIKGADESHADAGDRANDAIRIDGHELRCKVLGEGANLGVTQLGRIEFALNGGRVNTDFVDNSAGVDCSDHEVNIKIALGDVVQRGDMTVKQRNQLMVRMTNEVAELVLRDNYQQTQAITVSEARGHNLFDRQRRFMRTLERAGQLDREIEFLPDDEEIDNRLAAKQGLTRPEISVLLSYAKIVAYEELLESDLPDEPLLVEDLMRYFPKPLREGYPDAVRRHRLRREIVATMATNSMITRVGATFITEMQESTGRSTGAISRAYLIARDTFKLRDTWDQIEALDNKIGADIQTEMLQETNRLGQRNILWFLRNGKYPLDITRETELYADHIRELRDCIDDVIGPDDTARLKARAEHFVARKVPAELAEEIARVNVLSSACDIVRIAIGAKRKVKDVAMIYFGLGTRFGIDWLRGIAQTISPENAWQKRALDAVVDDLYSHQSTMTNKVLDVAGRTKNVDRMIDQWVAERGTAGRRAEELIADLRSAGIVDVSMLAVANRELRNLIGE
ncbi:MAG: NAD-glutamate dehydrogenase, partial [Alphaproteobacteria bacterium]|nr:NAD-glutamate dehydrogenase [Alphaproteobacteria bacterium]